MNGPVLESPPLAYAKVALDRPLSDALTYFVPESLSATVRVGSLVRVPLRGGEASGVVVDLISEPDTRARIKPIARQLTPEFALEPALIDLGRWIARYYFCSLGEALATISMIGLNDLAGKTRRLLRLADPRHWLADRAVGPDGRKPTAGHAQVIEALLSGAGAMEPARLRELTGVGEGVLRTMLQRGWLIEEHEDVERADDYTPAEGRPSRPDYALTAQQAQAWAEIEPALVGAEYRTFLLHGVTGSGKTELYLRLIEAALTRGRTAIMLVPEISLTPQTVDAFRRRLGPVVGVYHSRQTLGQKFDLWRGIVEGRIRVVVGARSALFAPLARLAVIVVDEEHETSYKQGETPRYHARDVAVVRASRAGAVCVLGSATPSIESLHNAREGKYTPLRLPERVSPHPPPLMNVIDMKRHTPRDPEDARALISPPLREAIDRRLAAGEQTILLLNRRGFATHILCAACEESVRCENCDVPMTYHKTLDRLLCHWCGAQRAVPAACPACQAQELNKLGFGTQKIEDVLAELFPSARTLRIDVDTMRRRTAFVEAWEKIRDGAVDIIFGTQMIAKGLHLEAVTLVGVISADFALFMPDFRSAERTHALLTQVAGRAGRGARPGEVIVQSYMPQHYAIDLAARREEDAFHRRELHTRRLLRFPPFARLAAVTLTGADVGEVRDQAHRLANMLKALSYRETFKGVKVFGASAPPLGRLEGRYRFRVLLRGERVGAMHDLLRHGLAEFERARNRNRVDLVVDIDPVDFM